MGREAIIRQHRGEIEGLVKEKTTHIDNLRKDASDLELEARKDEIDRLNKEIEILNKSTEFLNTLEQLDNSDDEIDLDDSMKENRQKEIIVKEQYEHFLNDIPDDPSFEISKIQEALKENKEATQKTHQLIEAYLKTYKADKEDNAAIVGHGIGLGWGGLIIGIAGLMMSILGYAQSKESKQSSESLTANEGSSGSSDMNLIPFIGVSPLAVGADEATAPVPSADEIEQLMQTLVINKGMIASGSVPQDLLWKNLASGAESLDLEGHDLTLMFIQEASVDLPGSRDFFWLDTSDVTERCETLRKAYRKPGKLSDVYLEATKIEYDGNQVPTFQVALLLQFALRLIKHDLLYPDRT